MWAVLSVFAAISTLARLPVDTLQVRSAIDRSIVYLQTPTTDIQFPDYAVYSYLQRSYTARLPEIRPTDSIVAQLRRAQHTPESFLPFVRLTPNINLKNTGFSDDLSPFLQNYTGIDSFTVRALWAEKCAINEAFLADLQGFSMRGNYEAAHAFLALIWLAELDDPIVKTPLFCRLSTLLERKLSEILTSERPFCSDVYCEILALLVYKNGKTALSDIDIATLLAQQTAAGAWRDKGYENAHTTVLALWSLLAYTQPTTAAKWIER